MTDSIEQSSINIEWTEQSSGGNEKYWQMPIIFNARPNKNNLSGGRNMNINIKVQKSNKLVETLHLPKILNINPGSVYNKS